MREKRTRNRLRLLIILILLLVALVGTAVGKYMQTVRFAGRVTFSADLATNIILRENKLCERYAQAILRVPGQQGRVRILRHAAGEGLSVKETEKLIDEVLSRMPVPIACGQRMKPLMRDYRLYVNAIRGIVEQMEDAGLEGNMQVSIGRHVAEVRVTIPIFSKGAR